MTEMEAEGVITRAGRPGREIALAILGLLLVVMALRQFTIGGSDLVGDGVLPKYVSTFAVVIVMLYCGYVLGKAALAVLAIQCHSRTMKLMLSTPLGLGIMSFLAYALGQLHLLIPEVFAAVLAVVAVGDLATREIRSRRLAWPRTVEVMSENGSSAETGVKDQRNKLMDFAKRNHLTKVNIVLVIVGSVAALFLLARALSPVFDDYESSGDEIRYYASMSRQYIVNNSTDVLKYQPSASAQPQTAEMLFISGMLLVGDSFPRLFSFFLLVLVALGIYSLGKDVLRIRLPIAGAVLFLATPFTLAPTQGLAHSRPLLVLFSLMAAYILCLWVEATSLRLTVLMAVFTGLAMGTQVLGLLLVALIGVAILLRMRSKSPKSKAFVHLLVFATVAVAVGGLWYARSYLATGSPVYPFFTNIWHPGDAFWNEFLEFRIGNHARDRSGGIFFPHIEPTTLGHYWLPFLPAVLLLGQRGHQRATRYLLLVTLAGLIGAVFLTPTMLAGEVRYAYHLFPMLSLLAAATLGANALDRSQKDIIMSVVVSALFILAWSVAWTSDGRYLVSRLKQQLPPKQTWAESRSSGQQAVLRFANQALPPGSVILSSLDAQQFFSRFPIIQAQTSPAGSIIYRSNDLGTILGSLKSAGITHFIDRKYGGAAADVLDRDSVLFLPDSITSALRRLGDEDYDGWVLYEIRYDAMHGLESPVNGPTRINVDLSSVENDSEAWKVVPSNRNLLRRETSWAVWQLLQDRGIEGKYSNAQSVVSYRLPVATSGWYELWGLDVGTGSDRSYGFRLDGAEVASSRAGRLASSYRWRRSNPLYIEQGEHIVSIVLPAISTGREMENLNMVGLFAEPKADGFIALAERQRASSSLIGGSRLTVSRDFNELLKSGAIEGFWPGKGVSTWTRESWFSWTTGRSSIHFSPISIDEASTYFLLIVLDATPPNTIGRQVNVTVNGHHAGSLAIYQNRLDYVLPLNPSWLKGSEIEVFFDSKVDWPLYQWLPTDRGFGFPIRLIAIESLPSAS